MVSIRLNSTSAAISLLYAKPTVGFTLPWAGVTPAPSERRKEKMRDFVPVRRVKGKSEVPSITSPVISRER
jgi:hypothetical protein